MLIVTGNERKVGSLSGSVVLLREPLTPGLPGLVLALGVVYEDGGCSGRHLWIEMERSLKKKSVGWFVDLVEERSCCWRDNGQKP